MVNAISIGTAVDALAHLPEEKELYFISGEAPCIKDSSLTYLTPFASLQPNALSAFYLW
jgi:hypothetical protein